MDLFVKEPKTKRGLDTLLRICESARDLFYQKGYHNTSINDITDGANIAPGTFYIYFDDKLNLYKYLLLQYSHEIRNSIRLATEKCETRYEKEAVGLKTYLEYIHENKHAYRIIWESQYIDNQLFREYYENFCLRYTKGLIEGQKNGEIRNLDPKVLSYMLMGISNFVGLKWVIFDDLRPYDDVVDTVMTVLSDGMFIKNENN